MVEDLLFPNYIHATNLSALPCYRKVGMQDDEPLNTPTYVIFVSRGLDIIYKSDL